MTTDKKFKADVRAYAARNGISYAAAYRRLTAPPVLTARTDADWTPENAEGADATAKISASVPNSRMWALGTRTGTHDDGSTGQHWFGQLIYGALLFDQPQLRPPRDQLHAAVEAGDLAEIDALLDPLDRAAAALLVNDPGFETWDNHGKPALDAFIDRAEDVTADNTQLSVEQYALLLTARTEWVGRWRTAWTPARDSSGHTHTPGLALWRPKRTLNAALVARHGGVGMNTPVRLADGRLAKVLDLHWGPTGSPVAYLVQVGPQTDGPNPHREVVPAGSVELRTAAQVGVWQRSGTGDRMVTSFDQQCEALLMHLEETEKADNAADDFLAALGVSAERRFGMVKYLVDQGLATDVSTLGGADCWLTGAGHRRAQQLINQRPARRVAELRTRMLRWLEPESHPVDWSGFLDSDQVDYLQQPFTRGDVEHQAEFLYDSGLITSVSVDQAKNGSLRPALTPKGRDCLVHGGDVAPYLGIVGRPGHTVYNTTSQDTHIGSISGGQQAFHSSDFTQVQHNQPAAGYEQLAEIVQQLLAQLPQRAELTDQAREEIHEAAEETLEVITGPEPKPSKVRRMVDGIVGVLGRVATTLGQGALQGANESTTQWATEHTQLLLNALPM